MDAPNNQEGRPFWSGPYMVFCSCSVSRTEARRLNRFIFCSERSTICPFSGSPPAESFPGNVSERSFLLIILADRVCSGTTGNEDLRDRVTAETVTTVDTTGHLTGCVQAIDCLAVCIEYVTLHVYADTTHGVVGYEASHRRGCRYRPCRSRPRSSRSRRSVQRTASC